MANFTTEEANACTISRAEKVTKDGVHLYWIFGINDSDGNYHDWKDTELVGNADDATQKAAIHSHLVNECTKKPAKPVIINISNDDIINTTVG
jgi:hypothetical protein